MKERSSTPLQVRFKNEVLDELRATADEMGATQVGLVKLCVVSFMRWAKENNVKRLPDDWAKVIGEMDGRKTRYAPKVAEANSEHGRQNKQKKKGGKQ